MKNSFINATIDSPKVKKRLTLKKTKHIINENEIRELLSKELPEINCELEKLSNTNNVYKTMECFVGFTKQLINTGKINTVKQCFNLAEKMLEEGNNTVKNAIENVYVYSLGTFVELSVSTAYQLKEFFNGSLKKEYIRQVMASGI